MNEKSVNFPYKNTKSEKEKSVLHIDQKHNQKLKILNLEVHDG